MNLRCTACDFSLPDDTTRCPRCLRQSTVEEVRPPAPPRGLPLAGWLALTGVAWLFHVALTVFVFEDRWFISHDAQRTGFRMLVGLLLLAIYGGARSLGTWSALAATLGAVLGVGIVIAAVFGVATLAGARITTAQAVAGFAVALVLAGGITTLAFRYLRDR